MELPVRILFVSTDGDDTLFDLAAFEDSDRTEVTAVSTAAEGRNRLAVDDFDCIVSADELPKGTGIEFLTAVRERYPTLPFILFGTDMSDTVTAEATAAGVTDVVEYSVDTPQGELLLNRIRAFACQYRLEEERNQRHDRFEQATEIAAVGVWEYRMDTDQSFASEETLEIYGLSSTDDLAIEKVQQYYHPDDRVAVREAFQQARDHGESFDCKVRLISDDGTQRWVRLAGEALRINGETRTVRGIIQDVSERESMKVKIRQQNDKLNDLIQVVTHDIRNALQVGFGQLEHAQETSSSEAFDRTHEALERIRELMDRIVTLSQQGQEPRQIERIDLADVAQAALKTVNEPRLTLTAIGTCSLDGDPARLQRLFERLFENTAKYTETSVTVTIGLIQPIRTTTREESGLSAGFYIEDDGPGLDEELTDHIFKGGYTTTADETGFRLANIAQIADAHGWEMNVSTSSARGTRFAFVDRSVIES